MGQLGESPQENFRARRGKVLAKGVSGEYRKTPVTLIGFTIFAFMEFGGALICLLQILRYKFWWPVLLICGAASAALIVLGFKTLQAVFRKGPGKEHQ